MYAIPLDGNVRLQKNDALREYARLEYRAEDTLWLRAAVKAATRSRGTARRVKLFGRRAPRSHAPVACKGTPRGQLQEAPSLA